MGIAAGSGAAQDDLLWIDGGNGRVNHRAGISVEPGRRLVSSLEPTWLDDFGYRLIRMMMPWGVQSRILFGMHFLGTA